MSRGITYVHIFHAFLWKLIKFIPIMKYERKWKIKRYKRFGKRYGVSKTGEISFGKYFFLFAKLYDYFRVFCGREISWDYMGKVGQII